MKFLIVTHTKHKFVDGKWFAYEPYIREMNLWLQYVDSVTIVAPISKETILPIEECYVHPKIKLVRIPSFNVLNFGGVVKTLLFSPLIYWKIFVQMAKADHIHLRCPGNVGLIGTLLQILFPKKKKTAKYAGNWDPNSNQPKTYRMQKDLLSNTFLTRNMKALVYGNWPGTTKNIIPFFTATYYEKDKKAIPKKSFDTSIKMVFVGGLTPGKRPLIGVQVTQQLKEKGYPVLFDVYGDGPERSNLEDYIRENKLADVVTLHGNVHKDEVRQAFIDAHFLIFISKSEGWPKVVAEAMFWKCVPLSSQVSCIPYMLDYGNRGSIITSEISEITEEVISYLNNKERYHKVAQQAQDWSRNFTMDSFDSEIKKLIHG
ncbi:MAG: glycosyltransferase [Flavobacteriaceae bacterium]|nr:glycosyltransferase [Flavobacteriaceae bacterium]